MISRLLPGGVYYLLLTPMGLILKMTGRDPMNRQRERSASTYWVEHPQAEPPAQYFIQFSQVTARTRGGGSRNMETVTKETKETIPSEDFEQKASTPQPSLVQELWDFLRSNKKWWLTPIILVLLLAGLLVLLSQSAAAPFVYTLF